MKAPLLPIRPVSTLCLTSRSHYDHADAPLQRAEPRVGRVTYNDALDDDSSSLSLHLTGTLDYLVCRQAMQHPAPLQSAGIM